MNTTLQDMLAKRPVDRDAVEAHKKRMLDEIRAYCSPERPVTENDRAADPGR